MAQPLLACYNLRNYENRYAMTFGGDYGYKDSAEIMILSAGAESMRLSAQAESMVLSADLLLPLPPPCCRCCCLCLRRGSSGSCAGVAVCRRRGGGIATTVVVFVLVFFFFCYCFCCSMPMGLWCSTSSRPRISTWRPSSLVLSSHQWRQQWRQQKWLWWLQMRCITAHPPPCRPILIRGRVRGRAMRARVLVVVVGSSGKDTIITAAVNRRHPHQQHHHQRHWLNPTATAVNNDRYCRHWWPLLPMPHSQQQGMPEASGLCLSSMAAMAIIVDGSSGWWQPRWWRSLSTVVIVDGGG